MPKEGEIYSDLNSHGREVKIIDVLPGGYIVETVSAADDASTQRAVGKVTSVSTKTFEAKFRLAR